MLAKFLSAHGPVNTDPETGASYLVELWRSRHHYRALADEAYKVSDAEISAHVARANRFFLDGAQPR